MRIQSKPHIFLTSLLIVLGFGVTSIVSYMVSLATLRRQIEKHTLPLTSDTIYSEVQRDLLRPVLISSLMAQDTFLRDWVLRGERNVEEISRYLGEIQTRYATESSFFVSEKSSKYYYSGGVLKTMSPEDSRDAWYYKFQKFPGDYEANLDVDMAHRDALTIFTNYKVFDYRKNFLGATGVGLDVDAVTDTLRDYQKRYARNICFFDRQGNITLGCPHFLERESNLRNIPGLKEFFKTIIARESSTFQYDAHGDVYHVNTRFIPEFNWYLLVEQGEASAKRDIFLSLLLNLGVCGVLAVLVILSMRALVERYEKKLEAMAITDKLTGLYNRHAFQIFFTQVLAEYERIHAPFSLIMVDLDDFKKINDMHGHLQGDRVLREVGRVFQENLRGMDLVSRWGGEEFVMLLKACSREAAFEWGETCRKQVENLTWRFSKEEEYLLSVTISFGVVQYEPGETQEELFFRADKALYRAKNMGKNRGERG